EPHEKSETQPRKIRDPRPPHCSKTPRRFPARLPWSQPIEQSCYGEPHHGSSPNKVRRINTADVRHTKREEGCHGENAEPGNQRVQDRHIPHWVARGKP